MEPNVMSNIEDRRNTDMMEKFKAFLAGKPHNMAEGCGSSGRISSAAKGRRRVRKLMDLL